MANIMRESLCYWHMKDGSEKENNEREWGGGEAMGDKRRRPHIRVKIETYS